MSISTLGINAILLVAFQLRLNITKPIAAEGTFKSRYVLLYWNKHLS